MKQFKEINLEELRGEEVAMNPLLPLGNVNETLAKQQLLRIGGVEGVGEGENNEIIAFVRSQELASRIAPTINGRSVRVIVTGPVQAL